MICDVVTSIASTPPLTHTLVLIYVHRRSAVVVHRCRVVMAAGARFDGYVVPVISFSGLVVYIVASQTLGVITPIDIETFVLMRPRTRACDVIIKRMAPRTRWHRTPPVHSAIVHDRGLEEIIIVIDAEIHTGMADQASVVVRGVTGGSVHNQSLMYAIFEHQRYRRRACIVLRWVLHGYASMPRTGGMAVGAVR